MRSFRKWLSLFMAAAVTAASISIPDVTAKAADGWYSQDFTGITDAKKVANSMSGADYMKIVKDDTHGDYFSYDWSKKNDNSRGAVIDFTGVDVTGQNQYIVEFDASIKPGANQVTYLTVKGTDFAYIDSKTTMNSGAKSGYLMNLVNSTSDFNTYTLNDKDNVKIPSGEWCHYTLYVDKTQGNAGLVTTSITGASSGTIADKVVSTYSGSGNVAGLYLLAGRYNAVMNVDNIAVRAVTDTDVFGKVDTEGEELNSAKFTAQLNTTIYQPADAIHLPIAISATGDLGNDITDKVSVTWSMAGLETEDGYVSLTREQGTGAGTDGAAADGTSAYFNVRNGVSTYFGYVQADVTYRENKITLKTPFVILGSASAAATQLAPQPGYYDDMNSYAESMVGYQGTASDINEKDLVLNGWSIYGSNGTRKMTLVQDADKTKSLEFTASGSGSCVAVYQWEDQKSQYIIDFTAKFPNNMAFGVYNNTPNNGYDEKKPNQWPAPEWEASYDSARQTLTVGNDLDTTVTYEKDAVRNITNISANQWYRFVISADPSVQTYTLTVYDAGTGENVGSVELPMTFDNYTQKYFCFQGTWPMNLQKFKAYLPTAAAMTFNASSKVVKVPTGDEADASIDLSATLATADGIKLTGAVDFILDDEDTAGITITKTSPQAATLTVGKEAAPGTLKVYARQGNLQEELAIQLTTSSDVVAFSSSPSSFTIPFAGEDAVTGQFTAATMDKDGNILEGAITYKLLDKGGVNETTVRGVTLGADGLLTVASNAVPTIVFVYAENEKGLNNKTKVNIHGLSFAFGSQEPEEGLTAVTDTQYTSKLGYGFASLSGLMVKEDSITGDASTSLQFKAAVPNGNYTVTVDATAGRILSEEPDDSPISVGIQKSGNSFSVAVCDGVLDLTFANAFVLDEDGKPTTTEIPAEKIIRSLTISQLAANTQREKPAVLAIGDSTTNNTGNGRSWGNCVTDGLVTVPDCFSGFSNHGRAGRNSASYYREGLLEQVLLSVCPGDYVTVNMGINSEVNEPYELLLSKYYIDGIIQRGGIPVIVTATPDGPVGSSLSADYDAATGKFTNNRGDGARNNILRKLANEKGLNLIELGKAGEDWLNTLTLNDVAAYNSENSTSFDTVLAMVQSWYSDHNHYWQPMGKWIGNFLLSSLAKLHTEEKPGTETPGTEQPGTETQGTETPDTTTPDTTTPDTTTPDTTTPDTTTPDTTTPDTATPDTTTPDTTTPDTTTPDTTTPDTTTPDTTTPDTTTPDTTTPGTTTPDTTTPSTTTPDTTTPGTTTPDTTTPDTTTPDTQAPDTQTPSTPKPLAKGKTFTVKKVKYKVTNDGKTPTVTYYKAPSTGTKLTVDKTVKYKDVTYKINAVAAKAFSGNKKVKTVTIGNNVTTIGKNAFANCSKLETVTIGTGIKTIESQAFKDAKALKTLTINGTKLTTIGKNAFKGVSSKVKVKVPNKQKSKYEKLLKDKGGLNKKAKVTKK